MSDSEYSSDIEEQEDLSPIIADFISDNKNELEQLLQLTNKMNMLNDQLKSIKKERKEIEENILSLLCELPEEDQTEGEFNYKTIKINYSIKKTIKVDKSTDKKSKKKSRK